MRVLFVTDLHGGNAVFFKAFRMLKVVAADILLIGGDIAGKYLVPILSDGRQYRVTQAGRSLLFNKDSEVASYMQQIAEVGGYGVLCSLDEAERLRGDMAYLEEVLRRERVKRLREWLAEARRRLAPERFLLNMGNDDPFYLDEEVRNAGYDILEDRQVSLSADVKLISCGYTNPTPWNCPRDCTEEELWSRLERKFSQCESATRIVIANLHCPPSHSRLDRAPRLDRELRPVIGVNGVEFVHVGSVAVRRALERFSPAVALHGHIHESYGKERIGQTVCVNPGSGYHERELRGAIVTLNHDRVEGVQLVREY